MGRGFESHLSAVPNPVAVAQRQSERRALVVSSREAPGYGRGFSYVHPFGGTLAGSNDVTLYL